VLGAARHLESVPADRAEHVDRDARGGQALERRGRRGDHEAAGVLAEQSTHGSPSAGALGDVERPAMPRMLTDRLRGRPCQV
jgi:hypothetical protein